MKNKIVLLDTHAIIHRAYHALPDFSTRAGIPTGGLYGTFSMLIKIIEELKPDHIIACYDLPQPTFRHEAYEDYKKGRPQADDALVEQIKQSYKIFEAFNIPVIKKPGYEADDLLGTLAEILKKDKNNEIFIATGDMDTLQLVDESQVKIYTFKKGNEIIIYDEEAVLEKYGFGSNLVPDYKGLAGDPSDNIPGIKGIGDKTAKNLLISFGSLEEIYKNLKKDKLPKDKLTPRMLKLVLEGEEDAFFSRELAQVIRDVEVDFELPQENFSEKINFSAISEVCREFEFRNIFNKLKKLFDLDAEEQEKIDDLEKLEKLKIAVHLLNPNITDPTLDDVLNLS